MGFALVLALAGLTFQSNFNGCIEVRAKSIKPRSQFEKQGFLLIGHFHPPPTAIDGNLY